MRTLKIFLLTLLLLIPTVHAQADGTSYRGLVLEVIETNTLETDGPEYIEQKLRVRILNKDKKGQELEVLKGGSSMRVERGNTILLLETTDQNNNPLLYVTDFYRTGSLTFLFVLFLVVVVLVSRKWGLMSVLGMAYSFVVILRFILPMLLSGASPLFVAILGAMAIAPVTFFLSHGVNKKSGVALFSTFIALLITGILASIFIKASNLLGFGSEEAYFLQILSRGEVDVRGLLLAGIIIGTLGVLDDVTVTQASIVSQLKRSNPNLGQTEIFSRAMKVGHDHIASTVNTLILVYTGASLPLLLLFINSGQTFGEVINSQILAEEIVSTLVGSIGLVLAVPITTFLASPVMTGNESDRGHHHH